MTNDKKIVIVEDEVLIAEHLKSILVSFGYTQVWLVHSLKNVLEAFEKIKPDLVLLDIRIESETEGLNLGKKLNDEFKTPFIYITAFSEKSILGKALNTFPASIITKPFKQADIFSAVNLVFINQNSKKSYINFKNGTEFIKLNVNDILFVERNGNYINIQCLGKHFLLRNSLEWIVEKLPKDVFFRIHRSYLVNLRKITKHTSECIYINQIEIPISRNIKKDFFEKMDSI